MMQTVNRPTGFIGFIVVWLGQITSVLATNMSAFALTIFVFQKTGSATALGLVQVFFITPYLIITPFAGVMVDRYNRNLMMMVSDLVAGVGYSFHPPFTGERRSRSLASICCGDLSRVGKCLPVARVFRLDHYNGFQKRLWAGKWSNVID
jgi:MFS family permease